MHFNSSRPVSDRQGADTQPQSVCVCTRVTKLEMNVKHFVSGAEEGRPLSGKGADSERKGGGLPGLSDDPVSLSDLRRGL